MIMMIDAKIFSLAIMKNIVHTIFTFYRKIVYIFRFDVKILDEVMSSININGVVSRYFLRISLRAHFQFKMLGGDMMRSFLHPDTNIRPDKIYLVNPTIMCFFGETDSIVSSFMKIMTCIQTIRKLNREVFN